MQTLSSKEFANVFYQLMETMKNDPETHRGLRTGIPELDNLLGGLHYGWYIVIGGPEKAGKSAFLVSLAKMFGAADQSFYYAGYEMDNTEMAGRMFANLGGISTEKFRDITLNEEDWKTMAETRDTIAAWNGHWNYGASPKCLICSRKLRRISPGSSCATTFS